MGTNSRTLATFIFEACSHFSGLKRGINFSLSSGKGYYISQILVCTRVQESRFRLLVQSTPGVRKKERSAKELTVTQKGNIAKFGTVEHKTSLQ